MPCPLPRWTQPVYLSVTSRSGQPSLMLWQVGVHDFTFEACSGFTRVTACRVAQPPWVAFVTRLRPGPARRRPKPLVSYQTYRQLSGWDFHPLAIRAVGAHITFPPSTSNYLCFLQHSSFVATCGKLGGKAGMLYKTKVLTSSKRECCVRPNGADRQWVEVPPR